MHDAVIHMVLDLEAGSPQRMIVWREEYGRHDERGLALTDFGPFDEMWDVALALHRVLRDARRAGLI